MGLAWFSSRGCKATGLTAQALGENGRARLVRALPANDGINPTGRSENVMRKTWMLAAILPGGLSPRSALTSIVATKIFQLLHLTAVQ